ncbi:hydrogenase expression/formation protein HypE [Bacteroidota bacterium]
MDQEATGEKMMKLSCPVPISQYDKILLAHGGGGKLTNQLIEKLFYPLFDNEILQKGHDGAYLQTNTRSIAFTTDSFVVDPIFFPGGNIGDLAVNGTVNDLLCCGAIPKYLSLAFIIEEGLLIDDLWTILVSIKEAADAAGVSIVTGDTKVVPRGKGDQIFINTTGIGERIEGTNIGPDKCREGDVVIINGSIADHGIAIMSKRKGLTFETEIQSDTAALTKMVLSILEKHKEIHVLRDPTRGGLASALNEIASASSTEITINENQLPISDGVKGACEIMGFDPLYIANEGKILIILPENEADQVLGIMKEFEEGRDARIIGRVQKHDRGLLTLKTSIGSTRVINMISGEQLPRIC